MGGGGVGVHPSRLVSNVAKPPSLDGHNAWDETRRTRRSRVAECCPPDGGEDERAKPGRNYRSIRAHLLPLSCTHSFRNGASRRVWNAASVRSGSLDFMGSETCCRFGKCSLYPTGDTILSFRPLFFFCFLFLFDFHRFGFRRLSDGFEKIGR